MKMCLAEIQSGKKIGDHERRKQLWEETERTGIF